MRSRTPMKEARARHSAEGPVASEPSLAQDIFWLVLKIVVIVSAFALLFTFVFGLYRSDDAFMTPNVRDGDLVLFYRLDRDYIASDVVMYENDGAYTCARVAAVAGDTVDIDDGGLLVNGSYQQESNVYARTTQLEGGIGFPVTVGEGQVFVLGDNRTGCTDSRIFGCIDVDDTEGTVIGIYRRREI